MRIRGGDSRIPGPALIQMQAGKRGLLSASRKRVTGHSEDYLKVLN
jgi:hypothetical protein